MGSSFHFCLFFFLLFRLKYVSSCLDDQCRELKFPGSLLLEGERLIKHVISAINVMDRDFCELQCYLENNCVSINFEVKPSASGTHNCDLNNSTHQEHENDLWKTPGYVYHGTNNACGKTPCKNNATCQSGFTSKRYRCLCIPGFTGQDCEHEMDTCDKVLRSNPAASDGRYQLAIASSVILGYCDMTSTGDGWTLIARFSNQDAKNWMNDTGNWWYDKNAAFGEISDPSNNTDMISPAFWLVSGNEFKITRSDDPQHTPLLQTTDNCLAGQTFRSKVTSYGDFRNGITWASDQCLGSCSVQYGGEYQTTDGFQQAACSGEIQGDQAIGFWCDWSRGDGAVLMIGGGGSNCSRADHGIGITEANEASFVHEQQLELDFGGRIYALTQSYSLNLWML